jgi:hypothetical protein
LLTDPFPQQSTSKHTAMRNGKKRFSGAGWEPPLSARLQGT